MAALEKEKQRIAVACGLNTDGLTYEADVQLICAGEFKADPEVLRLNDRLQQQQFGALMGDFLGNLTRALQNPVGFTSGLVKPVLDARRDMARLLSLNGCASKPTKQFQRRLLDFGSN